MRTKVKALTLNEMVIVMIITAIVVGLAFTVLTLVQRHMWAIQQNFNLNTEFNRLEEALWIDTHQFNTITANAKDGSITFKTVLDSTTYRFEKGYTLRDTDTFKVAIARKTWFLHGENVATGKLDAMRLELPEAYKAQQLFIFKRKDATYYID